MDLNWSISGYKGTPTIISELKFNHVEVYVTALRASIAKDGFFLAAYGSYGNVYHGKAIDDDYLKNRRKGQFSHSSHPIKGDYTSDYRLKFGYSFLLKRDITLSPHIGYSGYIQKMRFKNGSGWSTFPFVQTGPRQKSTLKGLNSTFKFEWYAPEIGLKAQTAITSNCSIFAGYTLLYPLTAKGKGYWNLREPEIQHFHNNNTPSKSYGNILEAGVNWEFTKGWHLGLTYEFMKFYSKGGHQRKSHIKVPMHRMHLTSNELRLSLGYSF